jgi:hypothetical protein
MKFALMMEALNSPETSVYFYETTRGSIPEGEPEVSL